MTGNDKKQRDPLAGKQVSSPVGTGGGGPLFQARTQALYLANMLTGLQTAPAVAGGRVRSIRFEARYTGAHTDDIYCEVDGVDGATWRCFVQCKLSVDVVASDEQFKEAFQAAWRDWRDQMPFRRSRDVLSITSAAPASKSVDAARQVCELARASGDAADLIAKLETPRLKSARVREAWQVFAAVSRETLGQDYSDAELFQFIRCLRFDVHDLSTDDTQEMVLFSSLLGTWCAQPEQGDFLRASLTEYCLGMGTKPGTATAASWRSTASAVLQRAFDAGNASGSGLAATWAALCARSQRQLSIIGASLPNGVHLERLGLQAAILDAVDEHSVVLISGNAGVGKSGVLVDVAPILAESGPLFVFRADELEGSSLDATLLSAGMSSGVAALEAAANAYARVTMVIDSMEKALEFQKRGALAELLALASSHKSVRLVVTARSHAVTGLLTNFLPPTSLRIVTVPVLTDEELTRAFAASDFSRDEQIDEQLRRVLRVPFYLRLAVSHRMRGLQLHGRTDSDLRKHLWQEGVAPSASPVVGLPERRRKVFDAVCFSRTEKLAQFVEAPADAEAVNALLRDGIFVSDPHGRVAPAHDVFEDWSLFFRIEKEVACAEQDWAALFTALGTHSGLRRAFRVWTAEQADNNHVDALSVLEYCLSTSEAPQLWRDEAMIGLLRSQACERLVPRFAPDLSKGDFALLKRMVHLLRVACKGPASSQPAPADESEIAKEAHIRAAMTTPVGAAWTHVVSLVEQYKESLPEDAWLWVAALLEDACHGTAWHEDTPLARSVFNVADYYLSKFDDRWYQDKSLPRRFFDLFTGRVTSAPKRAKEYFDNLVSRVVAASAANQDVAPEERLSRAPRRDFAAEERLGRALKFLHSQPVSAVLPTTVCNALTAMYVIDDDENEEIRRLLGRRRGKAFGFRNFGVSPFFPASGMSGPFRHLLNYRPATAVRFIVQLANKAAAEFRAATEEYVSILPVSRSANNQEHLHCQEFWHCYRGLSVTDDMLTSALMALEARLLFDAKEKAPEVLPTLEWILENGISTLTTAVVASVVVAHPEVMSDKLMGLFRSPDFFLADRTRRSREFGALAVYGGHDGLDAARQQERVASNRLPHRQSDLQELMLRLQFEQPSRHDTLFAVLDGHIQELEGLPKSEQDDDWRVALKRMDVRGLRLGPPVGDGNTLSLEIVNLDSDLVKKSEVAAERVAHANRRASLDLWADSLTGEMKSGSVRFSTPAEVLDALRAVRAAESEEEAEIHLGLDHKVAAAMVIGMFGQDSTCDKWAVDLLLDPEMAPRPHQFGRNDHLIALACALVKLASERPGDSRLGHALATIAVNEDPKVRFALADAIGTLPAGLSRETVQAVALGLARYAQLTNQALEHDWDRRELAHRAAARLARRELESRLAGSVLPEPMLVEQPGNPGDWTIALHAARGLAQWPWRETAVLALFNMIAASESSHDNEREFDYEARQQVARLFASELLRTDTGSALALERLRAALEDAPEFCTEALREVLEVTAGDQCHSREAFWTVWGGAGEVVFKQKTLLSASGSYRGLVGVLRELLFVGSLGPRWQEGLHHLAFFDERPTYVADCLRQVGDTQAGLQVCLELMYGVGRKSAIPGAIPLLRDAVRAQNTEPFDNPNSQWYAETICRVAVHEHRDALLKSKPLREATLDILNRLIEAGSSIAFQLRDYLATKPAAA